LFCKEILGKGVLSLTISNLNITGGKYYLSVYCTRPNIEQLWSVEKVAQIYIESSDVYKSGFSLQNKYGVVAVKHKWENYNI
jgi:hypothetical protein